MARGDGVGNDGAKGTENAMSIGKYVGFLVFLQHAVTVSQRDGESEFTDARRITARGRATPAHYQRIIRQLPIIC